MIFGSVCSGIEAASVAWDVLGWRACWFAEVDKAASQVLAHRFPDVPNHGDMTLLAAMVRERRIPAPDVLVGGTPCQAFSVAGMRQGLADPRGQLTLSFVDLANAIDEVRAADGKPPCVIVWENVPGVLSSKDNAFGCFLAGIAGESDAVVPAGRKWTNAGCVLGPERAIAWRVLDAQYLGLAQRRRRVFVVAGAGAGFDPAAILLEFDGLRRDSPPSRTAGEGVAGTLDARTDGGGFPGTDGACSGHVVPATRGDGGVRGSAGVGWPADVACTLNAHFGEKQGLEDQHVNGGCALFVPSAITVVHGTQDPITQTDCAFPLGRNTGQENAVAFSSKDYGGDACVKLSPTLRASGHGGSHANGGAPPAVAYGFTTEQTPKFNEQCALTLTKQSPTGGGQPQCVAYAFQPRIARNGRGDMGDIVNALTAQAGETGKGDAAPCVAYSLNSDAIGRSGEALTPSADADGLVRLRPPGMGIAEEASFALTTGVPHAVAYASSNGVVREVGDVYATLDAARESRGTNQQRFLLDVLPFNTTQITSPSNGSNPDWGDPCHGLAAKNHPPAVCVTGSVTHTLKAEGFDASEDGTGRGQPIVCGFQASQSGTRLNDTAGTLDANYGSRRHNGALIHMAVRRLMPVECERLQGFPDGWTAVPTNAKGKIAADGPRYKQLGNSMAVNVMRWIGWRIAMWFATFRPAPALSTEFDDILGGDETFDIEDVLG